MKLPRQLPPYTHHMVLDDVSWEFYEHFLDQIGDRPYKATFCDGSIEVTWPILEHERAISALDRMVGTVTLEAELPVKSFGSTTFRRKDRQAGLEPHACFYLANWKRAPE